MKRFKGHMALVRESDGERFHLEIGEYQDYLEVIKAFGTFIATLIDESDVPKSLEIKLSNIGPSNPSDTLV